jgi:PAS domain S-box-containing protein
MVDSPAIARLDSIADPVALLEGVFEHAPVALQICGADGRCLLVNRAFRKLFGADLPPGNDVFHDEVLEREGIVDLIRRAFEGEPIHVPPRWYEPREPRQGQVSERGRIGLDITVIPLRDASERVGHVALCFKDASPELLQHDAADALRDSEARKASVIEGALDCIITMDCDGLVKGFNPAAERTFGYSAAEAIGRSLADLIVPASLRQAHRDGLKRFLRTGEGPIISKRLEMTGMRADGKEIPVELVVTSAWSQGRPIFTGFVRDLTEQRAAEEALSRSEERYRRLVDAGIIGIFTADTKGNVLDANGAFLEMVGYSLEEVRSGRVRWADMTPPEWRHLDERAIEQLRATGVATPWEKEYIRKDGTRVPILVGVVLLDGATGECACFSLDLSERKQAQAAVERMREEREAALEASIQVRDDFLAIAGHELKTPLAALLMQVQSLQRTARKYLTESVADRLDKAAASGLRLDRLINQLLDVSRITAGRLRLDPEAINLADVVREVVARYVDADDEDTSPIDVKCEAEVTGCWDRLRIDQVINNLVANAVKYGQGKTVEVELRREGGEAVIRVVDHGIGIGEDHQRKIFHRFERAVTTRDFGGFGLGLWIARHIVEASGGRIEVQSKPGEGAAFTVRLPTSRPEPSIEVRDVG